MLCRVKGMAFIKLIHFHRFNSNSPEKYSLPNLDQDPSTIWVNHCMTTGQKMEQLHNLANKTQPRSSSGTETIPTVTIIYTSNSHRSRPLDKVAWYLRDQKEETLSSSKRSGDSQGLQARTSDTKKRKVRNTKKLDVASILEGFT